MKDFVPNTLGLKVLTPGGYKTFAGVAYMGDRPIYRIEFTNNKALDCSATHKLICPTGVTEIRELREGQQVYRGDGRITKVRSITDTGRVEPVYDLVEVQDGHQFTAAGVANSNCEFVTDDETLIDPLKLTRMASKQPEFFTDQARWFMAPQPNRTYMLALDPSLGTGGDYAAIQCFMLPEMVQIAEWQHNRTDPRNQVRILMRLLIFLEAELKENPDQHGDPEIFWTVENNSIGEAVLQVIEDTGEERFPGVFVSEKKRKGQTRRFRKGFNTDNRKKLSACARFKSLVESDRMEIRSRQLIRELKNFVHREASFAAKPGEHDDLTSATLLIVRMLDVVLGWMQTEVGDLREHISENELYDDEPMPLVI
jgi:hypothetical protein